MLSLRRGFHALFDSLNLSLLVKTNFTARFFLQACHIVKYSVPNIVHKISSQASPLTILRYGEQQRYADKRRR